MLSNFAEMLTIQPHCDSQLSLPSSHFALVGDVAFVAGGAIAVAPPLITLFSVCFDNSKRPRCGCNLFIVVFRRAPLGNDVCPSNRLRHSSNFPSTRWETTRREMYNLHNTDKTHTCTRFRNNQCVRTWNFCEGGRKILVCW